MEYTRPTKKVRGQSEDKCSRPSTRPRTNLRGRGQNFGLEDSLASRT